MSTKFMNFLTTCWFISILICVIMEGTYFGSRENGIISNLSLIRPFQVGNLFSIPVFNIHFFQGLWQIMTWDYSFYTGYYGILRWFWMAVLTPGAVWGLATVFVYVWTQIISLFRLIPV
jgi:hypothetical protein